MQPSLRNRRHRLVTARQKTVRCEAIAPMSICNASHPINKPPLSRLAIGSRVVSLYDLIEGVICSAVASV